MSRRVLLNTIFSALLVYSAQSGNSKLSTAYGSPNETYGSYELNETGNSRVNGDAVLPESAPERDASEALRRGLVFLQFAGALYSFAAIGIICGDYFLPSVDCICSDLNLSQDVAAATFMSFATTSPELFVILISTFLTKSDIGIGAVVGSGMFNILGVATVGGLAATTSIKLDWWPLFRDSLVYVVAVSILVVVLSDGVVTLSESICMILYYFVYFLIMFWNKKIRKMTKTMVKFIITKWENKKGKQATPTPISTVLPIPTISHTLEDGKLKESNRIPAGLQRGNEEEEKEDEDADLFKAYFVHYEDSISLRRISASSRGSAFSERRKSVKSMKERKLSEVRRRSHNLQTGETYLTELPVSKLPETIEENNSNDSGRGDQEEVKEEQTFRSIFCVFPSDTLWNKFTWLALWPICFLFFWTIPDCRSERWKKFYALTFLMCIIWIGIYCYSGTWLISAIGTTFGIPDAVMGLTLLAIGGSMPEAISTYIMARQGEGGLGFSNSLGGNTMDICLCLGFPWLIMCIKEGSVKIISEGLQYNCLALVLGIVVLISVGVYTKFHMNRTMGFICCIFYVIFTVVSVLIELKIIQIYDDG